MKKQSKQEFHAYIRGVILLGFAMLLFKLLVTGNIANFIAPKMIKFIYFAFFLSLILGCLQVWNGKGEKKRKCDCCENHTVPKSKIGIFTLYAIFFIPIVSAFLFSNVTIDGSVAANRGMNQSAGAKQQSKNSDWREILVDQEEEPIQKLPKPKQSEEELEKSLMKQNTIQVNNETYIQTMNVIGQDVLGFKGKEITFTGFVYHDKEVKGDEIVVARYGITCCVADASVWGMIVSGKDVKNLPEEIWVKVTGTLDETTYKGTLFPLVKLNKAEKIETPKDPYVYDALPQ